MTCVNSLQADEELLLLEAVDMYGPSNWKDVWRHVGTKSEVGSLAFEGFRFGFIIQDFDHEGIKASAARHNSPSAHEGAIYLTQVLVQQQR